MAIKASSWTVFAIYGMQQYFNNNSDDTENDYEDKITEDDNNHRPLDDTLGITALDLLSGNLFLGRKQVLRLFIVHPYRQEKHI